MDEGGCLRRGTEDPPLAAEAETAIGAAARLRPARPRQQQRRRRPARPAGTRRGRGGWGVARS